MLGGAELKAPGINRAREESGTRVRVSTGLAAITPPGTPIATRISTPSWFLFATTMILLARSSTYVSSTAITKSVNRFIDRDLVPRSTIFALLIAPLTRIVRGHRCYNLSRGKGRFSMSAKVLENNIQAGHESSSLGPS